MTGESFRNPDPMDRLQASDKPTYKITVAHWQPYRQNQLENESYCEAERMMAGDMQIIAQAARTANIPKATGKRKIHIHISLSKGQHIGADDAYHHSVLDALTRLGYIKHNNCDIMPVQYCRADNRSTTITLRNI